MLRERGRGFGGAPAEKPRPRYREPSAVKFGVLRATIFRLGRRMIIKCTRTLNNSCAIKQKSPAFTRGKNKASLLYPRSIWRPFKVNFVVWGVKFGSDFEFKFCLSFYLRVGHLQ